MTPTVDRKRAIRRLCLVNAARKIKGDRHCDYVQNLKTLVKGLNTSAPTIYLYLSAADKALKQNPRYPSLAQLLALIPKYGKNRAVTRVFDAVAIDWAIAKYCESPEMKIMQVYQLLRIEGKRKGWKMGSFDSLKKR